MDRYMSVDEVDTALSNIAAKFPSICQMIELPNRTHEGRVCHAIRLSTATTEGRPAIVFTGGMHAREWGSCEILVNVAVDLLEAFTKSMGLRYGNMSFAADDIQAILNQIDILIFPLVNPDGRNYSQIHDRGLRAADMWRKNRRPASSGSGPDCIGVDINRNFDFLFDFKTAFSPLASVSASKDPCDHDVYQGPQAFSEPETRNVKFLFDSNPAVRWFVDVHSFSEDILFSWGDDNNQTTDPTMNFRNVAFDGKRGLDTDTAYAEFIDAADLETLRTIAKTFSGSLSRVREKLYAPIPSFDLYPTSGTSDDYAYSRHVVDPNQGKIFSFVVEWGREFQPLWEEMQLIVADVTAGLLGVCLGVAGQQTPPSPDVPHGVPAVIQSTFGHQGNFEFVTPFAQGGLGHWWQNNDGSFFWDFGTRFGTDIVEAVSMIQSSFGPGNFEIVARIGNRLAHLWRDHEPPFAWHGPTFFPQSGAGENSVRGNPALIQSSFGPGNFEVVTPMASGGLGHFWRGDPSTPWHGPLPFGENELVDAVSLIQSNFGSGNLEVVARIGNRLVHYSRAEPGTPWLGPTTIVQSGATGNPVLLQSRFGHHGNFELVTPMQDGTLAHFFRDNDDPALPWGDATHFGLELRPFDAATMIQSRSGELVVIARTSSIFREFTRDAGPDFRWHVTPAPGGA